MIDWVGMCKKRSKQTQIRELTASTLDHVDRQATSRSDSEKNSQLVNEFDSMVAGFTATFMESFGK